MAASAPAPAPLSRLSARQGGSGRSGRARLVRGDVQGAWLPLARVVRLPELDRLACPRKTEACALSGDELFRSIPQAGDVQFQEARTTGNLNDARGDTSSINLRNLGTGNTLVLLNGLMMLLNPT